ncbi:UNVERIFIED_CONTAM: single-stranded-DNA-specific exonuclease [Paenibacillus sp. PvR008]
MHEKLAKINGIEDFNQFLNPSPSHTHSPYLLKNIDAMANRIIKAIKNHEKIIIYADVDYDGISSAVILYKWLVNFTGNVSIKHVERSVGHGSEFIVDQIDDNTDLYIAVDSSSNDLEPLKILIDKGIDCLVIDHHTVNGDNPYCILVNPRQEGCGYPNKNVSGGLLVWKVCSVLDDYMATDYSNQYIDLAGFAVAADMMSMKEMENRFYYKNALENVQHRGLQLLFKELGKDLNKLNGTDFSYGVAPCITAATRADKMKLALNFMLCEDEDETKRLVKQLVNENDRRKEIQAKAVERLKPLIDKSDKCIVLYDPNIGKGYNGLVAQDISQDNNRPTIILGDSEDSEYFAGSYRWNDAEFSMMDLLNACEYAKYGAGHNGAGGTSVRKDEMLLLKEELNEKLIHYVFDDSLFYDLEFNKTEINERLILQVQEFYKVTGKDFEQGNFKIVDIFVEDKKPLGKTKNTVKVYCGNLELMKFKTDLEYYNRVPVFAQVEAIGSLNMNYWTQYRPKYKVIKTCQLFIEDYKEANQTK